MLRPFDRKKKDVDGHPYIWDADAAFENWDRAQWPHWMHRESILLRVFPPPEGRTEWIGAEYEARGMGLYPVTHEQFEGPEAEQKAFKWVNERAPEAQRPAPVLRGP